MYIQDMVEIDAKLVSNKNVVGYLIDGFGFIAASAVDSVSELCQGIKDNYSIVEAEVVDLGREIYAIENGSSDVEKIDNLCKYDWLHEKSVKHKAAKGSEMDDEELSKYSMLFANRKRMNNAFIRTCLKGIIMEFLDDCSYRFSIVEVGDNYRDKRKFIFGGTINAEEFKGTPVFKSILPKINEKEVGMTIYRVEMGESSFGASTRVPKRLLKSMRLLQATSENSIDAPVDLKVIGKDTHKLVLD